MADDDERNALKVVGAYDDPVIANLAKSKLDSLGIRAFLQDEETVSIDPLFGRLIGGVKILTRAADAEDAHAILQALDAQEDDHEPDLLEPRCPECESPYLRNVRGKVHCQRCGYKGSADAIARAAPYRAGPRTGDPVFRLVRRHTGLGLFVGVMGGTLTVALLTKHTSTEGLWAIFAVCFLVCLLAGWQTKTVSCSRPRCRTKLAPGMSRCPACNGSIEGEITRALDHHARRVAWLKGEALLPK
jgi:hypothetical protein